MQIRKRTRLGVACILIATGSGVVPGQFSAAQPPAEGAPPEGAPGSDSGLGGLLEGLDLPSQPGNPPAPSNPPRTGELAEESASNPTAALMQAYQSMRSAREMLARGQTDQVTQAAQRRAVDLLDQVIEAAESQLSSSNTSSSGAQAGEGGESGESTAPSGSVPPPDDAQPAGDASPEADGAPQSDADSESDASGEGDSEAPGNEEGGSEEPAGQGGPAEANPLDARGEGVWGHLPERTRGMLRAEVPSQYVPRYSDQISAYFRALAEMRRSE